MTNEIATIAATNAKTRTTATAIPAPDHESEADKGAVEGRAVVVSGTPDCVGGGPGGMSAEMVVIPGI